MTGKRFPLSSTRLHTPLTATPDSLVGLAFRVLQSGKAKDADVNVQAVSFRTIMRPNQTRHGSTTKSHRRNCYDHQNLGPR